MFEESRARLRLSVMLLKSRHDVPLLRSSYPSSYIQSTTALSLMEHIDADTFLDAVKDRILPLSGIDRSNDVLKVVATE